MKKLAYLISVALISTSCSMGNLPPIAASSTPKSSPTATLPSPTSTTTLPTPTPTPTITDQKNFQVDIVLDPSLQSENISVASAWVGYGSALAEWIQDNITDKDFISGTYRPAFEGEVKARSTLASIWEEFKNSQPDLKNKYLDDLLAVYKAGFIREYTWVFLGNDTWLQPDGLQLEDFSAWSKANIPNHVPETRAGVEITVSK